MKRTRACFLFISMIYVSLHHFLVEMFRWGRRCKSATTFELDLFELFSPTIFSLRWVSRVVARLGMLTRSYHPSSSRLPFPCSVGPWNPTDRVDEESIDTQVQSLRLRLLAQAPTPSNSQAQSKQDIRNLKSHDSHALAAAKQQEMNRMGRAFGIGQGYVEGKAFDREALEVERAER